MSNSRCAKKGLTWTLDIFSNHLFKDSHHGSQQYPGNFYLKSNQNLEHKTFKETLWISRSFSRSVKIVKSTVLKWTKKYIDQEPPYLMRQICVLQWEEIKTKNSGATHSFWGKRAQGWKKNILLLYFSYWPKSQSIRSNNCFLLDCNITSELQSFPFNFCGGTGFVYIPPTVYSTQFAYIWVGRACI